ncbi:YciI family protein [Segetibacter koreensis]|uniref:YciI family protein n=1 Tax=Segetibacter koreensis TaxID=398037 RepID=UPI00036E66CC|nr:YciI family protein [Segetibacter koreensis]
MNKHYFVLKLLPNRPDFAETMTTEERNIMQQHVSYWKEYLDKGIMLVFGPVLDPKGVYGLGIIAVDNEEQVKTLIDNDPASAINKYEYHRMMAVVPEK